MASRARNSRRFRSSASRVMVERYDKTGIVQLVAQMESTAERPLGRTNRSARRWHRRSRCAQSPTTGAMGKVIFLMNVRLDGYIEPPDHSLDWPSADDELLAWFSERTRSFEALVYGRRLFELMNSHWPTAGSDPAATGPVVEFARIWNAKPKVVVSSSIQEAPAGWRLMSGDPEAILNDLRRDFSGDLQIGGPTLAAGFIRRGLVDEYGLVV